MQWKTLVMVVVMAVALSVAGCEGREAPAQPEEQAPTAEEEQAAAHTMEEAVQEAEAEAEEQAAETAEETEAAAEEQVAELKPQTLCPVMGNPINKEVYADYKGKRVYFCCGGCPAKFKENPEKYMKEFKEKGIKLEDAPEAAAGTAE